MCNVMCAIRPHQRTATLIHLNKAKHAKLGAPGANPDVSIVYLGALRLPCAPEGNVVRRHDVVGGIFLNADP